MNLKSRLLRTIIRYKSLLNQTVVAELMKYAFEPGQKPPILPKDATQEQRDFVDLLTRMHEATAPSPPKKIP